jgi:hypothetical protein
MKLEYVYNQMEVQKCREAVFVGGDQNVRSVGTAQVTLFCSPVYCRN